MSIVVLINQSVHQQQHKCRTEAAVATMWPRPTVNLFKPYFKTSAIMWNWQ